MNSTRISSAKRGLILSISISASMVLIGCQLYPAAETHLRNPALPSIKTDYPGNPYKGGKFVGPYRSVNSGGESLWKYLSWKLNPRRPRNSSPQDSKLKVVSYRPAQQQGKPHIAWLGHATVVLSLNNVSILIDPILNSPKLFHGKRLVPLPVAAHQLSPDVLLATHAHRDHLDKKTVQQLESQSLTAFVPLKMGAMVEAWRPNIRVIEAGWYQSIHLESNITVTLLPALHWSRRSLFDTNSMLWGSYLISDDETMVFVAGDTGYADHFKEIGRLYDDIDYAILPIGSYAPRHLHAHNHMTPEEAILAFRDLNAKFLLPVHYGTYDLSDEPIDEPLRRFTAAWQEQQLPPAAALILDVGEVHFIPEKN